eukprot:10863849-Karenia_brevis.AAC.1
MHYFDSTEESFQAKPPGHFDLDDDQLVSRAAVIRATTLAALATTILIGADAEGASVVAASVKTAILDLATASHVSPVDDNKVSDSCNGNSKVEIPTACSVMHIATPVSSNDKDESEASDVNGLELHVFSHGHATPVCFDDNEFPEFCNSNVVPKSEGLEMLADPPSHASPVRFDDDEFPEFCNSNVAPQSDGLEMLAAPRGHASP